MIKQNKTKQNKPKQKNPSVILRNGTVRSEALLRGVLTVGWPTLPGVQCRVNERKTNQRDRAKGFQGLLPPPSPPPSSCMVLFAQELCLPAVGFSSSPALQPANPLSITFLGMEGWGGGGGGRGIGSDSELTSAMLVSHFLLCKFRRAGSILLLLLSLLLYIYF